MTRIIDIDDLIEFTSYRMKLGQPLETAFPKLRDLTSSYSKTHLIHAADWMWLQTHKGLPNQEITDAVARIVKRSLAFCCAREWESSRDKHDYVLLNVAILVGDQGLIDQVLKFVLEADVNADEPDFWRAQTGILKCRMLGDAVQAERQYEIMNLCKGKLPAIRPATKPVLRSFIADDAKAMQRQIKSVAGQFWKVLHQHLRIPVVMSDRDEIRLGVWDYNRFWPWPEAAILKLMARGGAKIQADEFWLPEQLIAG